MIKFPPDFEVRRELYYIPQDTSYPLNWNSMFSNDHPVHMEIGAGKGEFLAEISRRNPGINYLGIELLHRRILSIMKKLEPEVQKNVRLLEMRVDTTIRDKVPGGSIARIYIQHPDPWPKRRHAKHRLIQQDLIDTLNYLLEPEGVVELSTDHRGLVDWMVRQFAQRTDFTSLYPGGFTLEPEEGHIETYFDKKLRDAGFPPHFLAYKKVR